MNNEKFIDLKYTVNEDYDRPCEYINRLKMMLSKESYNIYTIEKMLDSYIEIELKNLNEIKDNIKKIDAQILRCNTIKEVYSVSKILSMNFKDFSEKIIINDQIQSIVLDGIDTDRIIELQDTIDEHKIAFKNKLEEVAQEYRLLFEKSNNIFDKLDEEKKNFILSIFQKYLQNINQKTLKDENVLLQESTSIFKCIFGMINTVKDSISLMIKHYWLTLLGFIGINYFTRGYLSQILKLNILNEVLYNSFIFLIIIFATCLIIWISNRIRDYKNEKENEMLAYTLKVNNVMNQQNDTINNITSNISDNNMSKSTITSNAPKEVKDNNFKGFDNSASFKPDDSDLVNKKDKYSIF